MNKVFTLPKMITIETTVELPVKVTYYIDEDIETGEPNTEIVDIFLNPPKGSFIPIIDVDSLVTESALDDLIEKCYYHKEG